MGVSACFPADRERARAGGSGRRACSPRHSVSSNLSYHGVIVFQLLHRSSCPRCISEGPSGSAKLSMMLLVRLAPVRALLTALDGRLVTSTTCDKYNRVCVCVRARERGGGGGGVYRCRRPSSRTSEAGACPQRARAMRAGCETAGRAPALGAAEQADPSRPAGRASGALPPGLRASAPRGRAPLAPPVCPQRAGLIPAEGGPHTIGCVCAGAGGGRGREGGRGCLSLPRPFPLPDSIVCAQPSAAVGSGRSGQTAFSL